MQLIRSMTNKKIISVLKGNAYGLGIREFSKYIDKYTDLFAVNNIEEAKKINSDKDILILTPFLKKTDIKDIKDNYILSIDNINELFYLDRNKMYRVHILVNVGINRFGVNIQNFNSLIDNIRSNFSNIDICGVYAHLSNTKSKKISLSQIYTFRNLIKSHDIKNIHILNSEGFLNYNSIADFDNYIRIGNLIYGEIGAKYGFKKIYKFFTKPLTIYCVNNGQHIGYGNTYKTHKFQKVAVIGCGYADKLFFEKSVKRNFIYDILKVIKKYAIPSSIICCNNSPVRVLGRPFMNCTILDASKLDMDSILEIKSSPLLCEDGIEKKYIGD